MTALYYYLYLYLCLWLIDAINIIIVIVIIKDKASETNSLKNDWGITLIQVISELFKILLLQYFKIVLFTDDLEFGFKKGLGFSDVILR